MEPHVQAKVDPLGSSMGQSSALQELYLSTFLPHRPSWNDQRRPPASHLSNGAKGLTWCRAAPSAEQRWRDVGR